VACASYQFYLYDIEEKRLSDWSREYGNRLPLHLFRSRKDKIIGISFNVQRENTMILYTHSYFCYIDLDKPIPETKIQKIRTKTNKGEVPKEPPKEIETTNSSKEQQNEKEQNSNTDETETPIEKLNEKTSKKTKRKSNEGKSDSDKTPKDKQKTPSNNNFKIINKYHPILSLDFMEGELVVIERPWVKVLQNLPATLFRHRYGT